MVSYSTNEHATAVIIANLILFVYKTANDGAKRQALKRRVSLSDF